MALLNSPYDATRRKIGVPGAATNQQTGTLPTSPAVSAMQQTGSQMRTAPVVGSTPGATPAAPPPPAPGVPQAPTATVDTSKTDALYADQLAQSDKDRALMQQVGLNTISGLQTRNASNAARMGLQAGGASYLSGQRSAAIQGTNAFNEGLQKWGDQRQNVMSGQANILGGAANTNAGNAQQAGIATYNRQGDLDKAKTEAQATQNTNNNIAAVKDLRNKFDYLFDKKNFKAQGGQYNTLVGQYENALGGGSDAEIAAAYNALMSFITPFQQAKEGKVNLNNPANLDKR